MKPKLLDLFCGAGGAAVGYYRAGFEVVGVDIKPQPHYPFEFVQGDVFEVMSALFQTNQCNYYYPNDFDAYHASPPCQAYSIMKNLPWVKNKFHPMLIEPMREILLATGKPYVIENVMQAKLEAGWLCGQMFGLSCYRHRAFETPFFWFQPAHPNHRMVIEKGRMLGRRADKAHESLGLDWMTKYEQSQSIPPAYTEYIGKYLMEVVNETEI